MKATDSVGRQGISYYRELCQKGSNENFLFDKYVFRRISIFPTIVFIKLGIQPNTATFISLVASLGSCFFLVSNEPVKMLIGVFLVFSYYTLDHVDGELARYYIRTGQREPSLSGSYFDSLVHSYTANLMLFCLGVAAYHQFGYWWAVYVGFIACIGMSSFVDLEAGRTIGKAILRRPEVLGESAAQEALRRAEWNQAALAAVRANTLNIAKVKKIGREVFGFPGNLIMIMCAVGLDAYLIGFERHDAGVSARLWLIVAMAIVHTIKTAVYLRAWLRLMRPIR